MSELGRNIVTVGVGLWALASPFGLFALLGHRRRKRLLGGPSLEGTIVHLERGGRSHAPVVQYVVGGVAYTVTGIYRHPNPHRVGERLRVWVDASAPDDAELQDSRRRFKTLGLLTAFGILGALAALVVLAGLAEIVFGPDSQEWIIRTGARGAPSRSTGS
jgi:hypothetical protein